MLPLAIDKVYEMAIVLELRETVDGRPPAISPPGTHGPRAFNSRAAADAYDEFVRPLAPHLEGITDLFVVSNGSLQSLPFEILLQSREGIDGHEAEHYGTLDWMALHYAITAIPSVDALTLIRERPTGSAPISFAIIGDPTLAGTAANSGAKSRVLLDRIGGVANRDVLNALPPLEAKDLLPDMRKSLGLPADWPNVYMGKNARKAAVAKLPWGKFDVVAFVTHGLTATDGSADAPILAEPALVLTPPPEQGNSASDDELLTASEISRLYMINTRLVLLVACSSAAGTRPGSIEGYTGLVRSFFLAGARTVLATHWDVNQGATDQFLTEMLTDLHNDPTMSIAHAHRAAIEWMLSRGGAFSHPHFWAPFAIVGDGDTRL